MEKCKVIDTRMSTSCNFDKDEDEKPVEESKYRGMIGSIIYLITFCFDIMFVAFMCACFQASLKESHLSAVKRIMRYLSSTQHMSLWCPRGEDCDLVGYSDFDFVGCRLDRKSISATCCHTLILSGPFKTFIHLFFLLCITCII